MDELTAKQRRFALEYLVDRNGTQAAIRAGYSKAGAGVTASRLLTNPKVRALIDQSVRRQERRTGVTADRVLREMARIAFADIGQAFDVEGNILPIHQMPSGIRRSLSGFEAEELFDGNGAERQRVGTVRKIKTWDKPRVLEMLAKHLHLFDEKPAETAESVDGDVVIRRKAPDGSVVEVALGSSNHHRPDGLRSDADAVGVPAGPNGAGEGVDRRAGLGEDEDGG